MMHYKTSWQIQEAKSRFSELIEIALTKGPQKITKRGEEIAFLISKKDFEKLQSPSPKFIERILNAPRVDLSVRGEERESHS